LQVTALNRFFASKIREHEAELNHVFEEHTQRK